MSKNKKQHIAGIFSDLLKKCANWFLYIFIDESAELPARIMNKRRKQLALLNSLDKWNTYYNFNQLVAIISEGIQQKYGLSPVQVLSMIYNIKVAKVAGIGETYTGTYFDGTNWVDGDTGEVLPDDQQQYATELAQEIQNGTGSFWTDFSSVVDWIVELLAKLGIGANRRTYSSGSASGGDWDFEDSNSGSFIVPVLAISAIAYYAYKNQSSNNTITQ